ncbi:DDE-type integrase/transposase/recombinase, partial [Klebsiella pneumoniae]
MVKPNQVWVYDITPISAPGKRLCTLAVIYRSFARNVVGWSMKPTLSRELALDALLMAVWRRKPEKEKRHCAQ